MCQHKYFLRGAKKNITPFTPYHSNVHGTYLCYPGLETLYLRFKEMHR